MKTLRVSASCSPFLVLIAFSFLCASPKLSLAQPNPNPPHSYFNITEVKPASGTIYNAPPGTRALVPFSGKGTVVAYQHDYEAYGNAFLLANVSTTGTPTWVPVYAGRGSSKIVTPAEGAVELADSSGYSLEPGSYRVLFRLEAYLTTPTGERGDQTDAAGEENSYFPVFRTGGDG